ncbi:metal-dependent hydrolase [Halosolutus gelatinilyticus]|uniref:metal-dependent hydrolase n=1 Tax=Halosolutus gelatinilyticus TaxID=2931975 RepID=UPI001FF46884|nr:metal-dependent hydrolase [Halosolutus gelatinilyticus]
MFIGHALLAFAVAALVADRRGWDRRRAAAIGVVAGAFATVPDVDVAYALVGLAEWQLEDGALAASTAFWDASRTVHRSVTHSLLVGAIAAPAFGLFAVRDPDRVRLARTVAVGLLASLAALSFVADGPLIALVAGLFAVSGALVAAVAARSLPFSASSIALAALWGLWSHPWGDFVTGAPPDWLYPLEAPALTARITLHPDPTLHLLGAFAIELAVVWFAIAVVCRLTDRSVVASVDRRAAIGATYGLVALAATPPTLAVSYHFVFSVLGVGLLCGAVRAPTPLDRSTAAALPSPDAVLEVAHTAVAAVAAAIAAYGAVYLFVVVPT